MFQLLISMPRRLYDFAAQNGLGALARLILGKVLRRKFETVVLAPDKTGEEGALAQFCDVLFLIGCWPGESKRYRVYNMMEALEAVGRSVRCLPYEQLAGVISENIRPSTIVIFRAPYSASDGLEALVAYCRHLSIELIFDVDDLVFDESILDDIYAYRVLSAAEKTEYAEGVRRYRQTAMACDRMFVATPSLARRAVALGKPAVVVSNGLNRAQIAHAEHLQTQPDVPHDLTIGYFSGSATHERDFAEAAPALLRLMAERDGWVLLIAGVLKLGPEWASYLHRVHRLEFMDSLEMLEALKGCDINIAPLEVGNPFCEAKSQLKFFEAAVIGVPTVASPTEPYRHAIRHGDTGMLADDEAAWYDALATLLDDKALRVRMGQAARKSALEAYGPVATAAAYCAALENRRPAATDLRHVRAPLSIAWVIPRIIIGGGGHRNIFRAAHYLERFGHDVRLFFTDSSDQVGMLSQLVNKHFYPFYGPAGLAGPRLADADVVMVTHWTTVQIALDAGGDPAKMIYFVQDFEPAFSAMGSDYILAENTYRLGMYCITSGPWCEHILKRDYGTEADHFRFPIDHDIYHLRPRTKTNRNIVFFAKPEMPRRCYEIGIAALREVKRERPNIEIILFGSKAVRDQPPPFEVTIRDVLPTLDDLAELYANADLGMVFSTTNPSLVPYEMMACGCPIVDLRRPGNEINYGNSDQIAFLASPMPTVMAQEIISLLDRPQDIKDRSQRGVAYVKDFPTELEMSRRVESLIVQRMRSARH